VPLPEVTIAAPEEVREGEAFGVTVAVASDEDVLFGGVQAERGRSFSTKLRACKKDPQTWSRLPPPLTTGEIVDGVYREDLVFATLGNVIFTKRVEVKVLPAEKPPPP
jgi:hypothetical protein